jgi:hypothetical protein
LKLVNGPAGRDKQAVVLLPNIYLRNSYVVSL